ncbi:MAG: SDR family NAD(P)-dependent oxidoreductase, partial [Campylobacterota bacterium]|nr:SDR family NAD(P)-dependent oxidoreductase [Campylobacterota bacterium]
MKNSITILITGCSTGIGFETAVYLKKLGYHVVATARQTKDIKHLHDMGFEAYYLDVTNHQSIKDVVQKMDKIDVLFNNAGYGQPGAVEDVSYDALKEQFETNVFGLHEVTRQVIPIMRKQGHGKIIQHSSVLGLISLKFRGAYNASKYAIEGLSDTLRLELQGSNISVSLLNTGPVISNFRHNAKKMTQKNIDIQNSIHKEQYEKSLQSAKSDVPFTLESIDVAYVVEKIIQSKNPKPRYYITKAT